MKRKHDLLACTTLAWLHILSIDDGISDAIGAAVDDAVSDTVAEAVEEIREEVAEVSETISEAIAVLAELLDETTDAVIAEIAASEVQEERTWQEALDDLERSTLSIHQTLTDRMDTLQSMLSSQTLSQEPDPEATPQPINPPELDPTPAEEVNADAADLAEVVTKPVREIIKI